MAGTRGIENRGLAGRSHDEIMAALPPERRQKIEARAAELIAEVEGLKALRKLAERSQVAMAKELGTSINPVI